MTRQAGCKRRVRARMARTGESYAAARSRLLADYPGMVPGDSQLDWMPGALHVSTGDATDVPGTGLARSEPATCAFPPGLSRRRRQRVRIRLCPRGPRRGRRGRAWGHHILSPDGPDGAGTSTAPSRPARPPRGAGDVHAAHRRRRSRTGGLGRPARSQRHRPLDRQRAPERLPATSECQRLWPTAPHRDDLAVSAVPGSGRHSSGRTIPGSTRSVPAKNRATSSRLRAVIRCCIDRD
jgi:hypothetical protein